MDSCYTLYRVESNPFICQACRVHFCNHDIQRVPFNLRCNGGAFGSSMTAGLVVIAPIRGSSI